jgi:hypothetical protein
MKNASRQPSHLSIPIFLETCCLLSASLLYRYRDHLRAHPRSGILNHAARFNSPHFLQKHLNSCFSGIAVWPHSWQINQPSGRGNIGLSSSPTTQYGQHTIGSAILGLPLLRPATLGRATGSSFPLLGSEFARGRILLPHLQQNIRFLDPQTPDRSCT